MTAPPWYNLRRSDQYVYHYTTAATLAEKILPSNRLRFSRFSDVSDPREAKEWKFNFLTYPEDLDSTIAEIQAGFNRQLKSSIHVACFCRDTDGAIVTDGVDPIPALYERGHSRPRMWAQYGDKHKGACLVFDRHRLNRAIRAAVERHETVVYDKIFYNSALHGTTNLTTAGPFTIDTREVKRLGIAEAARRHGARFMRELFFEKLPEWESEREYRWIVISDRAAELMIDFQDSLVGILIGEDFPLAHMEAVARAPLERNLYLATMEWRNSGAPQPLPTHPNILLMRAQPATV